MVNINVTHMEKCMQMCEETPKCNKTLSDVAKNKP